MNTSSRVKFCQQSSYLKGLMALITFILLAAACSTKEKLKLQDNANKSQQWDTGVALYSFNRFLFAESLDKAKKTGVEYIEGFSFHKLGKDFWNQSIMKLSDEQLIRMKELIEAKGLQMRSMYAGVEGKSEWKQLFKIADALDLEFLVGEPDPKHWDFLNKLAGEYDMQLAIHQHAKGKSRYWHPDSVLTALEGRDHFGACADLGHWVRSGLDPVESLKKLEGHIISVHAKDLDEFGNVEANDVKIGSGVIDYPGVIGELKRQGFAGMVYVECEHDWFDNLSDVSFAIEYLDSLEKR